MAQIDAALAYFDAQKEVSYKKAAELHKVSASTLARRHQGKQASRAAATSTHHQAINVAQKRVFLHIIESLVVS